MLPLGKLEVRNGEQNLCLGFLEGGLWPVQDTGSESPMGNSP